MNETRSKRESFRKLATQRTNAAINHLRILGHCSNTNRYEYTEEDIKKIFRSIESELKTVKAKFTNSSRSEFNL